MRLARVADLVSKHTWAYAAHIIKGLPSIRHGDWGLDDLLFERQKFQGPTTNGLCFRQIRKGS